MIPVLVCPAVWPQSHGEVRKRCVVLCSWQVNVDARFLHQLNAGLSIENFAELHAGRHMTTWLVPQTECAAKNESVPTVVYLELKTVLWWIRGKLRWREKGTKNCLNQSRRPATVSALANDSIVSILNTGTCCDACRLSLDNKFKILEGRITQGPSLNNRQNLAISNSWSQGVCAAMRDRTFWDPSGSFWEAARIWIISLSSALGWLRCNFWIDLWSPLGL